MTRVSQHLAVKGKGQSMLLSQMTAGQCQLPAQHLCHTVNNNHDCFNKGMIRYNGRYLKNSFIHFNPRARMYAYDAWSSMLFCNNLTAYVK